MKSKSNDKKYCFDIIFEWEDILGKELGVEVTTRSKGEIGFDENARKLWRRSHIPFFKLYVLFDWNRKGKVLMFDAGTKKQDGIYNNKKYIPCLIDYFLNEEQYKDFLYAYRNNPLVLVSSREVYEYLIKKQCPIKIRHFPLSLPDYYWEDYRFDKKYDLVMFARQNPLLESFVDVYEKKHPDFSLVRRKYENGHFIYYQSKTGKIICYGDEHTDYVNLVRKSKVALYTTPGMDGTRKDANGWNQVTPHFLEEIAGQCHIIARYPDNADTRWYEMNSICSCVKSYEEFERLMDRYRFEDVDLVKYKEYLMKHVTTQRANILREIIEENQLT